MCVSTSAYHAYTSGRSYRLSGAKDALAKQVEAVFYSHRRRYGARRIAAELKAQGSQVGRFQVRSLMRKRKLRAIAPRRYVPQTTASRHTSQPSPNLLLDKKNAPRDAREVIVGDITYLPLATGTWGYLASWQDTFTKRVVGWAVADRMTAELVTSALEKAIRSRRVMSGTIVHTDQGSQYVSNNFRALLRATGCRQSMSRRGNC
jgi:transposase InsO family protein